MTVYLKSSFCLLLFTKQNFLFPNSNFIYLNQTTAVNGGSTSAFFTISLLKIIIFIDPFLNLLKHLLKL